MKNTYRILILALATAPLWGCDHLLPSAPEERVVEVNAITVENGCYENTREYAGTVEEKNSTSLCFEGSGRITRVYVREGQHVKAGQLLATIDNANARNAYNAAKATLDRAQDGYDRAKLVYDKGSLPEVKWVEVQTQLNQARSMAEISRKNLEDCNLYAPVSGTICDKNMEVGMSVSPLVPVVRIMNMSGLYVKANIPEVDINKVKTGDKARVVVSAMGDSAYNGVVEERNVDADPLSHSYMVRIRLKGSTKGMLPGMVCRVKLAGESAERGYDLPNRAVQLDNKGRRFVWTVADSMARKRYVAIGDLTETGVLVDGGLESGDVVIVDGTDKVSDGTRVKIAHETGPQDAEVSNGSKED